MTDSASSPRTAWERHGALALTSIIVLLIGAVKGFMMQNDEIQGYLCTAALACIACYDAAKSVSYERPPMPETPANVVMTAWIMLAVGCMVLLYPDLAVLPMARGSALLCIALATVLRFNGMRAMLHHVPPYAFCLLVLPFFFDLSLYVSYPLRRIATVITAETWGLFDDTVTYRQTIISLRGLNVAITDACSGIEQLEAMLLLAYLVVRTSKQSLPRKTMHLMSIVTAIIIANSIRLFITIAGFCLVGEDILKNTPHVMLGYLQVAMVLALFIAFGKLLSPSEKEKKHDE